MQGERESETKRITMSVHPNRTASQQFFGHFFLKKLKKYNASEAMTS
jgi:hypothetical protein